MKMKYVLWFVFFCGVLNASDPYGFGNNPVIPFSWGGLAFSGAKFVVNTISDHKTEIVCNTISKVVEHDGTNLIVVKENNELRAEHAKLRKDVALLQIALTNSNTQITKVMGLLDTCNTTIKDLKKSAVAVEGLGLAQLHMLAAFEESENKPGFFTEKYKLAISKSPHYKKPNFNPSDFKTSF